jgi:hypothetical protein
MIRSKKTPVKTAVMETLKSCVQEEQEDESLEARMEREPSVIDAASKSEHQNLTGTHEEARQEQ